MKQLFGVLSFLVCFLMSCSSTDREIKAGLKASIPSEYVKDYDLVEYQIQETILDVNLKDSITRYRAKIESNKDLIRMDSTRLLSILSNLEECKHSRATTLYYLRSTFTTLIRDYEKMQSEIEGEIGEKEEKNRAYKEIVEKYETAISNTPTPIIYYKIKHIYTLKGMRKEVNTVLDYKYQPLK